MNYLKLSFVLMLACLFTFTACDDDDPVIPDEEELITTLSYTLTPDGGGTPLIFTFQDLDGDGGDAPTIITETLAANTVYTGTMTLLNELESPAENITEEIDEEQEEHQFFFSSSLSDLTVAYGDTDSNGDPVGLTSTLTTGAAGTGTLTVTLRHEPMKDASGVSGGDIANAGGETDIEVEFPVTVQ